MNIIKNIADFIVLLAAAPEATIILDSEGHILYEIL